MACAILSRGTATDVAKFDGPTPKSEQWKNSGIYSLEADAVYASIN
jgi:hypothetical protein